MNNKLNYNLI